MDGLTPSLCAGATRFARRPVASVPPLSGNSKNEIGNSGVVGEHRGKSENSGSEFRMHLGSRGKMGVKFEKSRSVFPGYSGKFGVGIILVGGLISVRRSRRVAINREINFGVCGASGTRRASSSRDPDCARRWELGDDLRGGDAIEPDWNHRVATHGAPMFGRSAEIRAPRKPCKRFSELAAMLAVGFYRLLEAVDARRSSSCRSSSH